MNTQNTATLPEKDLLFQVLVETKRVAGEYTIAVTESNCQNVRQVFTTLLNDTLQIQNEVFQIMSQLGWYRTPSNAMKQEITNQLQTYQQEQQQTQQFVQQRLAGTMSGAGAYGAPQNQGYASNQQNNYRMQ